jgi:hypothetical protein
MKNLSIDGAYEKLNDKFIEGYSLYNDYPLSPNTIYYYKISTVSQYGIEGNLSVPFKAWTSLSYCPGWPIAEVSPYGTRTQGSPMTEDVNNDLQKEVFLTIGDDSGYQQGGILAFKANGEELINYDGNPTFCGGFYKFDSASASSTPAIADINNDVMMELVVTTRSATSYPPTNDRGQIFVFSTAATDSVHYHDTILAYSGIFIRKQNGSIYHQNYTDGAFFRYSSVADTACDRMDVPAVVAELFQSATNNTPEMVFVGSELRQNNLMHSVGHVFILDANGQTIPNWSYNQSGHTVRISNEPGEGARMGPPVVGDVNDDGEPEIFLAGDSAIYGWSRNGGALDHFPIFVEDLETRFIAPLLADVDGDGDIEIVVASNSEKGGIYA